MVDRRCLQHFCGQHFRIGLESRVGVAFGTTLEQRYLVALAHPALGEGAEVANSGDVGEFCRPYMPVPSKAMRAITSSKGLRYSDTSFQEISSSARFIQKVSVSARQRAMEIKS